MEHARGVSRSRMISWVLLASTLGPDAGSASIERSPDVQQPPIIHFYLSVAKLPFTHDAGAGVTLADLRFDQTADGLPRVTLDLPGEAYFALEPTLIPTKEFPERLGPGPANGYVAFRVPPLKPVSGQLIVRVRDSAGGAPSGRVVRLPFSIGPVAVEDGGDAGRDSFYRVKGRYYETLARLNPPGAGWFRHLAREARALHRGSPAPSPPDADAPPRADDLESTYALFSGGQALSENLQLDRLLLPGAVGGKLVDLSTVTGITLHDFDWDSLTAGLDPERDPLAAYVPADQHAIFFPSFDAFVRMIDEASSQAGLVLQLSSPRSQDFRTLERYERQLGVSLDALARLLGPELLESTAMTGSDPYVRTGSDVALLLEAHAASPIVEFLAARQDEQSRAYPSAESVTGNAYGVSYRGVRSPDRRLSSYVMDTGNVVVLTNSVHQLERIARVATGGEPSLAASPEYVFFRGRYPRGGDETAFLVVTDATIRRWCGPRWRIAGSRRTRAAAALIEAQASAMTVTQVSAMDSLARGIAPAAPIDTDLPRLLEGDLVWTETGVRSSVYGDLGFLTPIAEIPLSHATEAEVDQYRRWRDTYEQNWRRFFDPIAVRFALDAESLATDVTVMPLIEGTEYRGLIRLTRGAEIAADAGDRHGDALVHFGMSIDTGSESMVRWTSTARSMAQDLAPDPLAWLGGSISVYADDDAFWSEMERSENPREFLKENYHRLPVALNAEVTSVLGLAAFLTAVRAFSDGAAPGLATWEALEHRGRPYVRVSARRDGRPRDDTPEIVLYYAATPRRFILSLNEGVLKRALDRLLAESASAGAESAPLGEPWLGRNVCLQVHRRFVDVLDAADQDRILRERSFANLPILNEWRRRYPDEDPVALHERFWHTTLVCPGGGAYVWNAKWQTMQSSAYGHPGEPKEGPPTSLSLLTSLTFGNFGLTFEDHGLRARLVLRR